MDVPPNQTLYLSNLNEKVRIDDLKRALYDSFSQFGPILDIVAHRNLRMKGQAFVAFQEVSNATLALRAMQGFQFFNKPMRVQYAKSKSDAVAKMDGTYAPRQKSAADESDDKILKAKASAKMNSAKGVKGMDAPNQILFLQNLPDITNSKTLTALFGHFPGFKEVRMVPNRNDIAFIEYDNESYASVAKESLQGFKLTATNPIKINYAKK